MARQNTPEIQAGQQGRTLANRDILKITSTTGPRIKVRRLTGHNRKTGRACWSQPFEVPKRYLATHATLAYATTQHAAQGRTVNTAHVLVDGLGDRQGLYVSMSRGRDANHAYCITDHSRAADVTVGSCPDPELLRSQQLDLEHAGLPPNEPAPDEQQQAVLDPVTVLAGILGRDGRELSAAETGLSRADHLGVLGGIWDDLTRRTQIARFEQALRAALPADLADQALDDPACTWLWRTLREAEIILERDQARTAHPEAESD
jgi:hypothetical protein